MTAVGSKKRNPGSSRRDTLATHKAALGASRLGLVVKKTPAKAEEARDMGLVPESERVPGGGHCSSL